METVIKTLIIVMCLLVVYAIYDVTTAEYISLRKDSWVCTKNHISVTYVHSGNIMIPIESKICDQWSAK